MIKATSRADGTAVTFNVEISGLAVYLDTFAVIDLAKGDSSLRKRFIDALHSGAELLFSVSNAAELSGGPQDRSLDPVRTFLDEVGPHWFPLKLNTFEVVGSELAGATAPKSCASGDFLKAYFVDRTSKYSPGSGRVINLSEDFFCLGPLLDWVGPQRESIRKGLRDLDEALIERIRSHRAEFERDPRWLDQKFPSLHFNPSMPATFTYINLVRTLILDAKAYQLKKGDGIDFCHAVMASAFASVATLDRHWKRRIESLPTPNGLAHIYYQRELSKMVTDIELHLKRAAPAPATAGR
jgi:hypothetical protein